MQKEKWNLSCWAETFSNLNIWRLNGIEGSVFQSQTAVLLVHVDYVFSLVSFQTKVVNMNGIKITFLFKILPYNITASSTLGL